MTNKNTKETENIFGDVVYYNRGSVDILGKQYQRYAIKTHFVQRRESYIDLVKKYVLPLYEQGDILSMSEKVIALCQDNIIEKKDVKVGFWAKFLSKFASSSSAGIAMDEPYKLQVAINLAGLPRILFASFCSAITKLFGKRGVFYKIAGHEIAGLDGFYKGSSFEYYKEIGILNPRNPNKVCKEIENELAVTCMLVDANDLSVDILGKSEKMPLEKNDMIGVIKDNPAGQSDELTPFILIREIKVN